MATGTGPINIQEQFLNRMRRDKTWLTVDLISGEKLYGTIAGFDNFCILLKGTGDQLIYKHAVAAITPMQREE
jgi:host factor-I protein